MGTDTHEHVSDSDDGLLELVQQCLAEHEIPEEVFTETLRDAVPRMAAGIFQKLQSGAPHVLTEAQGCIETFHASRRDPWGPAFDSLYMVIHWVRELAEMFVARRAKEALDQDERFTVLARLFGRGLLVAREVLHLLEGGYAGAAMARWRSLHELAVIAEFLSTGDDETVKRFVEYLAVDNCGMAEAHQQHCVTLGYQPLDEAQVRELQAERKRLCDKYGKEFKRPYGWAASALGTKQPNFREIERAVQRSEMRPFYKLACDTIHASVRTILFHPGLPEHDQRRMLAGPTNVGLSGAGARTPRSLVQLVASLLNTSPTATNQLGMWALVEATAQAEIAFDDAEQEMRRRIAAEPDAESWP